MRFSFATVVLAPRGGYAQPPDRHERARVLRWAVETGFAGIELNPRWYNVLSLSDADVMAFGREARDAGLCVSGLNLNRGILTRTELAQRHRAEAEQAIVVAALLSADVVNLSLSMPTLPTPDRPPLRGADVPEEEHVRAAEIVRALGRCADGVGVKIALDLHDDGLLDTPDLCLTLLDRVGMANVGINPDLGNICRGPQPPTDWRRALGLLAPRALNWHVKNYREFRPVPLWEGEIDYREVVAAMRQVGYRDWVSIESYVGDPFESQPRALQYLQELASTMLDAS